MSSVPQPFDTEEVFGLIRVTGSPIPIPDDQTEWPAHTPDFVSSCFLHLPLKDGERLRTLLTHILDTDWFRAGLFEDAPESALEPFVGGTRGLYVCQFCATVHANLVLAVDCVRMHIDI
ncbi:hypothetical protein FRC14_005427 [Serendipita sp. 396]|nr:hypothetical protein FRC14_005427 [Serendipita sp. 396]KAG8769762.1 hypothetical protein FRC15_004381 [Serendipita sp. 397]KAG8797281.1 hypothetical protein FRC16_009057 [Serendipita sp. 398]KAG8816392.1 hypothetical protein FRC18_001036 [Serendipita sp. 400]KAG8823813.1 hypothetical protein FRC19_003079 [Serendipita sp. 401]KAG8851287.1 hypothetical protein FRB91_008108 [Serendipita sp. 411]KAG8865871.1 hypothetical protein FRC20_009325 [Serendipita sp. 405]KAG9054756.1 hypothetical prot